MVDAPFDVYAVEDDAPLDPETLGTRDKFWFQRDEWPWLFKKSRPASGEHWAEVVAALLARRLGLPCAEYQLAIWSGFAGVVTPRFTDDRSDLVHGNELLAERDPSYEREGARFVRTSQHTIEAVAALVGAPDIQTPFGWTPIAGISSALDVFCGYLLLDAWIGNPDRHHENWAFEYRAATGTRALSPTFDHASSLGSHETDILRSARLQSGDPGYRVEAYVARAKVRSPFFASVDAPTGLSPLDAFQLWSKRADCAPWVERLRGVSGGEVAGIMAGAPGEMMSGPSRAFAAAMLEANRERILALR